VERLKDQLRELNIDVIIPGEKLVKYKEALIMALIGVLRWREKANVLSSVTGAKRDTVEAPCGWDRKNKKLLIK
jgi:anhydro-N-acetylmuramic acid kinase